MEFDQFEKCMLQNTVFNLLNTFLLFFKVYQEFDRLLEDQSPIEAYIEWLDSMVERCVVRVRVRRT